jgi:hypothetical protein
MLPTQKQPSGPTFPIIEAIGRRFVHRIGQLLDRLGARIEQHNVMSQRDDKAA